MDIFVVSPVDNQSTGMVGTTVPMLSVDRKNTGSLYIAGYTIVPGVTASFERPSRGSEDGKIS